MPAFLQYFAAMVANLVEIPFVDLRDANLIFGTQLTDTSPTKIEGKLGEVEEAWELTSCGSGAS